MENGPSPAPAPSAPSLRWEILRRAFLSRSAPLPAPDTSDDSSQMGIKRVSRKTSSHFNMIPYHLRNGSFSEDMGISLEIEDLNSQRDIYVFYKLPVMTAPSLILMQRIENTVDLRDFEISNQFDVDNTGLICCWPSEDVLAHICLKNSDIFSGKKVIELGSGHGLAGLAIAAGTDAREVVISDGNPQVVDYIQHNININIGSFGDKKVKSMILHWSQDLYSDILNTFDVVIASDCTFFKEFHESLALTVKSLLRHSAGSKAIFLSPRRGDSLERFLEKLKQIGLQAEVVENYDPVVWERHLKFLNGDDKSWPNYDKDHCYPLLVTVAF
uniref:Calmodulin-lysine N-methyltransferase n=1 Tax=Anthurium amnicola TaxID=1678845 RepID=A0A1D1Z2V1_9ARAE